MSAVRPVTDVSQLRTLAAATGSGQQAGGGVSSASADPWSTTHRTHQPSEAGQIYLHLDTRLIRTPHASYTSTCLRIWNPVTLGYSIVSAQQHTVGVNKNWTLVFVNFSAQDASILKISVPIIKRSS